MAWPESLNVALKEWAVVCEALRSGRQMILLRKGGIYESAGEFQVEHRQFLLFPTYLHQDLRMLKDEAHAGFEKRTAEPDQIIMSAAAEVTDIVELQSRQQMNALEDEHIWTEALIEMRFDYRPQNPLYLLLVRTYALLEPVRVENTVEYAGCKSWVPLGRQISTRDSTPALDDARYEQRRRSVLERVRL